MTGHTTAKIISHSRHPLVPSSEIVTFEVQAPRFILAEINTHGLLAKSAASSRAIPVEKRIAAVTTMPFVPIAFGKNARGMQARGQIEGDAAEECALIWDQARLDAVFHAQQLAKRDVHKQHANRVLEPYAFYKGVITATELDNFFKLRLSKEAQPEFEDLAREMKIALGGSTAVTRDVHTPYADGVEGSTDRKTGVSSARCARVSYTLFDGSPSGLDQDMELCMKLTREGHMSPFDHPAIADGVSESGFEKRWANPRAHGRFWGWIPMRYQLEKDLGVKSRRDSFEPIHTQVSSLI